ncbi:putative ROK family sugar kinase [Spiroplasma sabaudiense Ar-1343]|uniref:Putative ROK family sugar kinase n=1 Tax=Spiroplasma sabaudiense Ar-1343 TaxID=1276257 RepID=W6AAS4_9MOLU|nr:ROK family protein [Spiroplasma sabaudiense]AHI54258.1 putative ROK family sugar kinase [Spiroplasma sabaudiense Ar-1343]
MNLCFDVGGMSTKVAFIKNDAFIKKDIIKYDSLITAKNLFEKIVNYIKTSVEINNINNICLSFPGLINNETGEMSGLSAIQRNHEINFKKKLFELFHKNVYIENDAKCAAIAEMRKGNAIDVDNGLVLVIGTGIGSTVIINKKIHKGNHLMAGEIGCFLEKIENEKYLNFSETSGMYSLEKRYKKISGNTKTGKEIYESYLKDENAKELVNAQIYSLSKSIINISFTIDTDLVLIGGAISSNELFLNLLNKKVKELYKLSNMKQNFTILKCKFLNDSNLIGANELSKNSSY